MENSNSTINPSSLVNILTLRYDPNLKSNLPIKTSNDFKSTIESIPIDSIEKSILNYIEQKLETYSNEKMPAHVVDLTIDAFKESGKALNNSEILILGISYKPDVKDIQLTPAEDIIKKLKSLGANVHIYDPYFASTKIFDIDVGESLSDELLEKMDAAIIVTAHEEFKKSNISNFNKMKTPILIDTRGIIDPVDAKNSKLIFRGLGRGKQ